MSARFSGRATEAGESATRPEAERPRGSGDPGAFHISDNASDQSLITRDLNF